MSRNRVATDAFYPCGPPPTYEVSVSPSSDFVVVRSILMHPWRAEDGGTVLMPDMLDWEGSSRYVDQPCFLFRWLGDTLDARIARAKLAVSAWAEREIEKRRRTWESSRVTLATGGGEDRPA